MFTMRKNDSMTEYKVSLSPYLTQIIINLKTPKFKSINFIGSFDNCSDLLALDEGMGDIVIFSNEIKVSYDASYERFVKLLDILEKYVPEINAIRKQLLLVRQKPINNSQPIDLKFSYEPTLDDKLFLKDILLKPPAVFTKKQNEIFPGFLGTSIKYDVSHSLYLNEIEIFETKTKSKSINFFGSFNNCSDLLALDEGVLGDIVILSDKIDEIKVSYDAPYEKLVKLLDILEKYVPEINVIRKELLPTKPLPVNCISQSSEQSLSLKRKFQSSDLTSYRQPTQDDKVRPSLGFLTPLEPRDREIQTLSRARKRNRT